MSFNTFIPTCFNCYSPLEFSHSIDANKLLSQDDIDFFDAVSISFYNCNNCNCNETHQFIIKGNNSHIRYLINNN